MKQQTDLLLSVIVPVYNEEASIGSFYKQLLPEVEKNSHNNYEIIFCNDGSNDRSPDIIKSFAKDNTKIKLLSLTRNFGKEVAITAGIHAASGSAIITIDGDGQHPPKKIEEFIRRWRRGSKVVIGLRTNNQKEGIVKRWGSKFFYKIFNRISGLKLVPGATDYRLIDRSVQESFQAITEHNRITRGLIDWLGFKRDYIEFTANPRRAGKASYSFKKLFRLAVDSTISLSLSPLYVSAYLGAFVLPVSLLLGLVMLINAAIGDPLNLHAKGSAYLVVLLLFLMGILLVSQGIIGLYLSHIHTETQDRPLYVIDKASSINIHD